MLLTTFRHSKQGAVNVVEYTLRVGILLSVKIVVIMWIIETTHSIVTNTKIIKEKKKCNQLDVQHLFLLLAFLPKSAG